MAEDYQNGNRPIFSRNEAVRYALLLVAVVAFAITLKVNQDGARLRQDATDRRIDALTAEVASLREDVNEWKRATTGLVFRRPHEVEAR